MSNVPNVADVVEGWLSYMKAKKIAKQDNIAFCLVILNERGEGKREWISARESASCGSGTA